MMPEHPRAASPTTETARSVRVAIPGSVRTRIADDCNANGRLDSNDVLIGASADANSNGVPDECEGCNHKGDRLTFENPWCIRLGPDGDVYVSRSDTHRGGGRRRGCESLHLTIARGYQFDMCNGELRPRVPAMG